MRGIILKDLYEGFCIRKNTFKLGNIHDIYFVFDGELTV